MPNLAITNLTKIYNAQSKNPQLVFDNFSLEIKSNIIVAVVGVNGCGKTTLLNCLADLIPFELGRIKIDDKDNQNTKIGFVFQNYRESLLPWLKNIDNVACTLEQSTLSKLEKHVYIKNWAVERNIVLPWGSYPYQCSGGQQQLLALVREFINQPKLLLMDEPFTALDYEKRLAWRQQLELLWQKCPTTIILVSHDIEEAIYLADEVIVLGNQPTKIFGHYTIDLPRPRVPVLLQSEKFSELYRKVSQSFLQTIPVL
ncbi:MAG: ABC-type nitrate/sulfonate/bicarbonate transport system, ATPase component [Candidatus Magasanikbacteria bacterium GW2011_GWC2_37_14]|uniref:ABC-type nitrate/sulfonate/bicarbonate transport system, ATPase component n=1 Tax=Candidatus Magasanikbacteria bacterium GW2011_GWC2_37_14 TaxID=1619046 RepID=A0A0G0G935_9BACT|nr:MAG: ABC-type nitrate/sulfonate/bicarbonate transport system, ATPase component [Candidatus Magasanikbacteria bacterium GW2011_GWC2_37_14]